MLPKTANGSRPASNGPLGGATANRNRKRYVHRAGDPMRDYRSATQPTANVPQAAVVFPIGFDAYGFKFLFGGGQGRNRTTDTRIFSRLPAVLGAYESITCSACQPRSQSDPGTFLAHPI